MAMRAKTALHGRLKLARLMSLSEDEAAKMAAELQADPLFSRLVTAGAVAGSPLSKASFAARQFAGWDMRAPAQGLGDLLDGASPTVELIRRIGMERFQECFLAEERLSDAQRAKRCGISSAEAASLRGFVDTVYIRGEFEAVGTAPPSAPRKVFSTVAGIAVAGGKPSLRYFNREVWKARYRVDQSRLEVFLSSLPESSRDQARRFASRIAFVERRKTTLLQVLESLLVVQAKYLISGDPAQRQPLTQRSISAAVGVDPSVINRLVSNKAVELPWGLEAPLKALMPSAKTLAKEIVAAFALKNPGLSDEALRVRLASEKQIHLSRRSIAQYRKETGVGARGQRA